MRVYSIFESIQGESSRAGNPCTFVRLAGCRLNCNYCDTRGACISTGRELEIDQVERRISEFGWKMVEITGGEPLLQEEEVRRLANRLKKDGYEVLIETSGTLPIAEIEQSARVIMDLKTPGSGECKRNMYENLKYLRDRKHEVKIVVTNREDFEWGIEVSERYSLWNRAEILMSPAIGFVKPEELSQWIMTKKKPVRLQLQLHKILWPLGEKEVEI